MKDLEIYTFHTQYTNPSEIMIGPDVDPLANYDRENFLCTLRVYRENLYGTLRMERRYFKGTQDRPEVFPYDLTPSEVEKYMVPESYVNLSTLHDIIESDRYSTFKTHVCGFFHHPLRGSVLRHLFENSTHPFARRLHKLTNRELFSIILVPEAIEFHTQLAEARHLGSKRKERGEERKHRIIGRGLIRKSTEYTVARRVRWTGDPELEKLRLEASKLEEQRISLGLPEEFSPFARPSSYIEAPSPHLRQEVESRVDEKTIADSFADFL